MISETTKLIWMEGSLLQPSSARTLVTVAKRAERPTPPQDKSRELQRKLSCWLVRSSALDLRSKTIL
jgi:hypothetical protein